MLKLTNKVIILKLESDEFEDLSEFAGRDVKELNPQFVVLKTDYSEGSVHIFVQLVTSIGTFTSHVINFRGLKNEEDVLITISKFFKSGIFRWNELLDKYDLKVKKII